MPSYTVAGREMRAGPDIAMYQPGADPQGEDFVIIKLTEGIGYLDPWATRHAAKARAAGKPWAFYHFARPGNDPTREADWFCDMLAANPGWTLPPVLDMEQPGTGAWVLTFCLRVLARTGWVPVIYTGAYVPFDRPTALLRFALWIAAYNAGYAVDPNPEAIGQPPSCAPWGRNWSMWQYTSSANVPGVPGRCDRSVADAAWLAGKTPTPVPEDDMPYSPDQLTALMVTAAQTATVPFIARDPSDGGMYVFCRLTMDRRPLENADAVMAAREQLGIPFLRGDDPNVSQDISPALVHIFALKSDTGATAVSLDPETLKGIVTQIAAATATAVRQELASALGG